MTTSHPSAPDLRRAIADVYLRPEPPPGAAHARGLLLALTRQPDDPSVLGAARALLTTVELRRRLGAALDDALQAQSALVALMLLGFRAQADAALCGAETSTRWRRAAQTLLDHLADRAMPAIDRALLDRLLALTHGTDDA